MLRLTKMAMISRGSPMRQFLLPWSTTAQSHTQTMLSRRQFSQDSIQISAETVDHCKLLTAYLLVRHAHCLAGLHSKTGGETEAERLKVETQRHVPRSAACLSFQSCPTKLWQHNRQLANYRWQMGGDMIFATYCCWKNAHC